MITKITASLLSISLLTSGLTASLSSPASAKPNRTDQLLIQNGLTPVSCNPGVVTIWINLNQQPVCAIPNSQYPAGVYRLTSELGIAPMSGKTSIATPPASNQISPPATPASSQSVNITLGTPTAPAGYPSPANTVLPNLPSPRITPPIVFTSDPSQPVSSVISAQINASLAARGLTLTSCDASPEVVITIGSYMACAYSTPMYPPGRYSLAF